MAIQIYALVDPVTREVHYVGKSTDPRKRLSFHLSKKSLTTDNPKNRWLRSLLSKGLRPLLIVLQTVTNGKWAEAERAWIVQGRMIGWPITNTSDGGEGVLENTPETVKAQRQRVRRRVSLSFKPKQYKRKTARKKVSNKKKSNDKI